MRDKAPKLAMLMKRLLIAIKGAEKAIQSQNEAITQATKAANAKQVVPPLVRAEVNLPEGIETHERATDAADDKKYRFWTLLVSWLTLIAVVFYAGLAYLQWREMIGATGAAQDAVHEARLGRQQAYKSLNATIDQFHLDQRAWLNIYITSEQPQLNQRMMISVHMANTGRTYALESKLCALSAYTNDVPHKEPLEVPKFAACGAKDWTAANFIPPNADVVHDSTVNDPMDATKGLNAVQVEWLTAGKTVLWQYGEITYRDIFEKTPTHWVKFCYYRIVSNGQVRWITCNTGNDVDREKDQNPN